MAEIRLSEGEARRVRVASQGLDVGFSTERSADAVAEITRLAGGLQGQDLNAAGLQARARSVSTRAQGAENSGLRHQDVVFALSESRSVVRTWAMRGTLHVIPSEDHRWLTTLLGAASFRAGSGRRKELGLHESTLYKAFESFATFFTEEGPLTRQKLGEMLAFAGLKVENQAIHHVVRSGGFLGYITHGPLLEGRTETFVPADEWLAGIERPELDREEGLARLAGRYVRAFGPSTARDFAVWSGLPLRDARAGWDSISGELVEVDVGGEQAWVHEVALSGHGMDSGLRRNDDTHPPSPVVRLLGFFDTYLLGYRGRGLAVGAEHLSRVNAGGGMIRPVVTVDGLAVGTWSWKWARGGMEISVEGFAGMEGALGPSWAREAVEREVEDIGRFLGVATRLGE